MGEECSGHQTWGKFGRRYNYPIKRKEHMFLWQIMYYQVLAMNTWYHLEMLRYNLDTWCAICPQDLAHHLWFHPSSQFYRVIEPSRNLNLPQVIATTAILVHTNPTTSITPRKYCLFAIDHGAKNIWLVSINKNKWRVIRNKSNTLAMLRWIVIGKEKINLYFRRKYFHMEVSALIESISMETKFFIHQLHLLYALHRHKPCL